MAPTRNKTETTTARFGAFGGVFTPCTLTILGVIMFLRLGQVVGRAGIIQALAILGFEAPAEGSELAFYETMERIVGDLPRGDPGRQCGRN